MIWKVVRQIAKTGICTEAAPDIGADEAAQAARIQQELLDILGQALTIREVDAGSCNGCELEINALGNPYYNLQGLGIKFVASPRHADMLLVTGPVSRNMETALKRTYEATPERPRGQRDPGRRSHHRLPARATRDLARHPEGGAATRAGGGLSRSLNSSLSDVGLA